MYDDDESVGRWLTRRELVALFGASAAAVAMQRVSAQGAAAPGAIPRSSAQMPACVVHPQQTEGPYFVDEKLLRSDVRSDPSNGTVKPGTPLELAIRLVEVAAAGTCGALVGAQVDIWHCDAAGVYSDSRDPTFDTTGQKFLRGYQMTDAAGAVRFQTIYPGWYPDRAVHIHFKVRSAPGVAPPYEFTSQLYFDEALTDRVHAAEPYASHKGRRMRNEEDYIYRRGGSQLLLSVADRGQAHAATISIGVRPTDAPQRENRGGWGGGGFGRGRRG